MKCVFVFSEFNYIGAGKVGILLFNQSFSSLLKIGRQDEIT